MADQIQLEDSWKSRLSDEFNASYMQDLKKFIVQQINAGKVIYPQGSEYFFALNMTPFDDVKVVILGQDPYHGQNQAHGLCFSVKPGVPLPPSLVNIYKEFESDIGIKQPNHGYLSSWASQGVLMLNSVLTVEDGKAGSHRNRGWEQFTDKIIDLIATEKEGVVFVLWGSYAQKKGAFIDRNKHLVINSPHPSPLSAYRGFFGSKPFSQINGYLRQQLKPEINWQLPSTPSTLLS